MYKKPCNNPLETWQMTARFHCMTAKFRKITARFQKKLPLVSARWHHNKKKTVKNRKKLNTARQQSVIKGRLEFLTQNFFSVKSIYKVIMSLKIAQQQRKSSLFTRLSFQQALRDRHAWSSMKLSAVDVLFCACCSVPICCLVRWTPRYHTWGGVFLRVDFHRTNDGIHELFNGVVCWRYWLSLMSKWIF
jgi:hypothetical protein